MNPILTFGLFALLVVTGAAMLLYGFLQRPGKPRPIGEECPDTIDDRLKPIVLDFQGTEPQQPESGLDQEQESIPALEPEPATEEEDAASSGAAADAFSRLNERFRRMKELEAEEKKRIMEQDTKQKSQAGEAHTPLPDEPEEPKTISEEPKTPSEELKPDSEEKGTLGQAEPKGA